MKTEELGPVITGISLATRESTDKIADAVGLVSVAHVAAHFALVVVKFVKTLVSSMENLCDNDQFFMFINTKHKVLRSTIKKVCYRFPDWESDVLSPPITSTLYFSHRRWSLW